MKKAISRHTPGPWRPALNERWRPERNEVDFAVLEHETYDAIEIYAHRRAKTVEEHDSNARLLAAAPNLLAACKLAEDCIDKFNGKLSPGAKDRLRAAIAKAEGR